MKQTPESIKRELGRLREYIDAADSDPVAIRVAYEVEQALRWATEDTVDWEKPVESCISAADLIRRDLNIE